MNFSEIDTLDPPDLAARAAALNPQASFIVQAPAGSGKTTLLVQRYLSLLSHIQQDPREILAITFTRKAAEEMQERIQKALLSAHLPEPPLPHQQSTWSLARQALAHCEALGITPEACPLYFQIRTIDSFCMNLVQHMPVLSGLGGQPKVADPIALNALYDQAVQRLLVNTADDPDYQPAMETLLQHLDNRFFQVNELLKSFLQKRDQWLPLLFRLRAKDNLRHFLEQSLQDLIERNLSQALSYFPISLQTEAMDLLEYALSHQAKMFFQTTFPVAKLSDLPTWQALIDLLLTQEGQWRQKVDKRNGFPAGEKAAEKAVCKAQKERYAALIEQLRLLEDLRQALVAVRSSPLPQYTDNQWDLLEALLKLLPVAVAELKWLFQAQGQVDFMEVAEAAVRALGDPENPTDLALRLEYQITHILVDEFQDTSLTQWRLLEALTSGWQPGDGHTLFLVGDPMQSIYRFRGAEVGLFLRARHYGIGSIPLQSLVLQTNFRSDRNLIAWVNQIFPTLFPAHEDIPNNQIPFTPSEGVWEGEGSPIHWHLAEDDLAGQDHLLVEAIQACRQQDPMGTIAILVQSRQHAARLIPALQAARLLYQAVEIDPLSERMVIQDLVSLTCALLDPTDRLAWFSVLRSPFSGMNLVDLHQLAVATPETMPLWVTLQNPEVLAKLSSPGQTRLTAFCQRLENFLNCRDKFPLREWVEETWLALQGPASLRSAAELAETQAFWELLETLEATGLPLDRALLLQSLSHLYAPASPIDPQLPLIQIMTIHRAKGLEFDTVILPCLEKSTQTDRDPLLLWLEQPGETQGSDLLIAPIKARAEETDPIYAYLKQHHQSMNEAENNRLLYVAVTRAKKRLYLLGSVEKTEEGDLKKPAERTWLSRLWRIKCYSFTKESLRYP